MKHVNVGRLTVGMFPYWIGFSWRYLSCMGRILDCGFIKFVWWRRSSNAASCEGKLKMNTWINCDIGMPDQGRPVLIYHRNFHGKTGMHVATWNGSSWTWVGVTTTRERVSHWMELPDAPADER